MCCPDIRLGGPNVAGKNKTYTLELFHDDPGADPLDHWNINWGDGNSSTIPGDAATANHVFTALAESRTISVSAVEADTGTIWPNPASPGDTNRLQYQRDPRAQNFCGVPFASANRGLRRPLGPQPAIGRLVRVGYPARSRNRLP